MYFVGFTLFAGLFMLGLILSDKTVTIVSFFIGIICSIFFKKWYFQKVKERITKIKAENSSLSKEQLLIICKQRGGVVIWPVIVFIICTLIYIFIALMSTSEVLGILDKARKASAEDAAYGILKSGENFAITHYGEFSDDLIFNCDGESCTTDFNGSIVELDFKGMGPDSGSISVSANGESSIKNTLVINGFKCNMENDVVVCK